jgi:hypothetical protein
MLQSARINTGGGLGQKLADDLGPAASFGDGKLGASVVDGADADPLLSVVRAAREANPSMGVKKLVAEIKRTNPAITVGTKEVRQVVNTLDAAAKAAEQPAPAAAAAAAAAAEVADTNEWGATPHYKVVQLRRALAHWQRHAKKHPGIAGLAELLREVGEAIAAQDTDLYVELASRACAMFHKASTKAERSLGMHKDSENLCYALNALLKVCASWSGTVFAESTGAYSIMHAPNGAWMVLLQRCFPIGTYHMVARVRFCHSLTTTPSINIAAC